jgi:glyoxylase-like metal-dependent hydrolase (beta-lactamase superfamily II)
MRFLLVRWCAVAILGAISSLAWAQAKPLPEIVLAPRKVSVHGWFFQGEAGVATVQNRGFMSNAGFVVTDEGIVVFDALGTPALGKAIVAAIRRISDKPIRRVIVSHYHADHIYGLQELKAAGAEVWSHRRAEAYLSSGAAEERLKQRRADLAPWIDEHTRIVPPDLWIDGDTDFRLGKLTFRIVHAEGAHSPEDLMLFVVEDRLLFAGDLIFAGRIPYVGNADSAGWLKAINKVLALDPAIVIPGHGPASTDVARDLTLTRDYLAYLRETMGRAVRDMEPFDAAYARTDWSRFQSLPAFEQANRINAFGTYLLIEQEELTGSRR